MIAKPDSSVINETINTDLEIKLRTTEASHFLRLYRNASKEAGGASIGLLDREIMRIYGDNLILLEPKGKNNFVFLYAGKNIPVGESASLIEKTTANVPARQSEFLHLGCSECLAAGDAVGINHRADMASRVHRWECLFFPVRDNDNRQFVVALCIPREHKDEFFRLLIDAAPDAAIAAYAMRDDHNEIVDATIVAANQRALELSGRETLDDVLETSLSTILGGTGPGGGWDKHLTALRSSKVQTFDYHHRNEKTSLWLRIVSTPIRDGVLVTMTDITEIKRLTLELDHQRKMLVDEMEQRRGLEQELWALAHLDPLTALPNRRAFREAATIKLAESLGSNRPCAVIAGDIDHFKRVNDAYGHNAGDTVLRRVSDIIKAPLRPNTDMGARMGGEEFAIILPDTDSDAAIAFAEKLRKRVEQTVIIVGEHEIKPTISLGVAMARKNINLDDLLDRADRALYSAKRSGRNCVATEVDVQGKQSAA